MQRSASPRVQRLPRAIAAAFVRQPDHSTGRRVSWSEPARRRPEQRRLHPAQAARAHDEGRGVALIGDVAPGSPRRPRRRRARAPPLPSRPPRSRASLPPVGGRFGVVVLRLVDRLYLLGGRGHVEGSPPISALGVIVVASPGSQTVTTRLRGAPRRARRPSEPPRPTRAEPSKATTTGADVVIGGHGISITAPRARPHHRARRCVRRRTCTRARYRPAPLPRAAGACDARRAMSAQSQIPVPATGDGENEALESEQLLGGVRAGRRGQLRHRRAGDGLPRPVARTCSGSSSASTCWWSRSPASCAGWPAWPGTGPGRARCCSASSA